MYPYVAIIQVYKYEQLCNQQSQNNYVEVHLFQLFQRYVSVNMVVVKNITF